MKSRFLALIGVLCGLLILGTILDGSAAAKWNTIRYDKWGFSVQIPGKPVKQTIDSQPNSVLSDLYTSEGLAYIVKLISTPDGLIASTAIEQAIQSDVKKGSTLGPAARWEQDSRQGDLFKGLTRGITLSAEPLQAALKKAIGSARAIQCYSMTPLKDESSPILYVGVVGPEAKMDDIVVKARGMAAFVSRYEPVLDTPKAEPPITSPPIAQPVKKPAIRPSTPEPQPIIAPQAVAPVPDPVLGAPKAGPSGTQSARRPAIRASALEPQPAAEPKSIAPPQPAAEPRPVAPLKPVVEPMPVAPLKSVTAPKPHPAPIPKPIPALRKGEIELTGSIESVDRDGKGLAMSVSRIRMPGQEPIELSPARPKTVLVKNLPKWAEEGGRIVVVGMNAGVGSPLSADRITPAP